MQVRIRTKGANRYLSTVTHEGRTYLVSPAEGEYEIVLTNNVNRRRMAVIAIDGMSIMNGELAKRGDQNGYVLNAWQTVTIRGWRRSNSEVASFVFTSSDGSYSNAIGNGTQNTGVISVAVFEEKEKPLPTIIHEVHHHYDWWGRRSPYPFPYSDLIGTTTRGHQAYGSFSGSVGLPGSGRQTLCAAPQASQSTELDLGTGYGSKASMRTRSVEFECASDTPTEIQVMYYRTRDKLRSQNIPVDRLLFPDTEPNPFPGSVCLAPPGWTG